MCLIKGVFNYIADGLIIIQLNSYSKHLSANKTENELIIGKN